MTAPASAPSRRRPRRVRGPLAVAAALALVAVACSSSGSGSGSGGATNGTEAAALPPCPLEALAQATQPVEVVVWHSLLAKQNDTMKELADLYNASQSKVRVRMENTAATDEELLRKFTAAVPSRQLPGIFVANDTMTQTMVDSQVALPAQSCINADNYDMSPFSKTVMSYYTVNGVLWAASANPGSALLFYNKDHFRRAGLDPDNPPKTLAEIRTAAEKIKAAGIVDKPFVHETASYKTEFWLTGAHAPIVNNDDGRSAPATSAALEGNDSTLALFRWFDGMNRDGLMQGIPVAEGQIGQYLAMAQQQASMVVESSSGATSIEAFLGGTLDPSSVGAAGVSRSGLDFGAGLFPGIYEPGRTQMGGPAWYIISSQPPEVQAAAWDFLKFMNSESSQVKMLTEASYLPYRLSAATTPEAKAFFDASLAGGWLRLANTQVQTIDPAFPGPLIGPYAETRIALRDALSNVLVKGTTPEAAIAGAQQEINTALQNYGQGGF